MDQESRKPLPILAQMACKTLSESRMELYRIIGEGHSDASENGEQRRERRFV
jgi:hypothetical protein